MQDEGFEWDDNKARVNVNKHAIDFNEAKLVFHDIGRLDDPDNTADYGEQRYRTVGLANGRLITTFYTERETRIRIISARKPTKKERHDYVKQNPAP